MLNSNLGQKKDNAMGSIYVSAAEVTRGYYFKLASCGVDGTNNVSLAFNLRFMLPSIVWGTQFDCECTYMARTISDNKLDSQRFVVRSIDDITAFDPNRFFINTRPGTGGVVVELWAYLNRQYISVCADLLTNPISLSGSIRKMDWNQSTSINDCQSEKPGGDIISPSLASYLK